MTWAWGNSGKWMGGWGDGGMGGPGPGQEQKPLLSLYQARYAIPAVAGARHFLCVAKESNQRKATAGLANRGAGQEPKRTIC